MIFEIWSIGDPAFLWEILNSIAMLAGSNDLKRAVMIAMLLGVIVIGFQSVQQGSQSISLQKPILAWVIYMLLFGWTATANINDVYRGTVRSVANVPGGVVAVGSWISSVGYWMTNKFEQTFSLPTMTADGFAKDIDYVLMARSIDLGSADGAMGLSTSISQTLHNYIKDCTATGLAKNQIDQNKLLQSSTALADIKYNSSIVSFKAFLNPAFPQGETLACDTGHARLIAAFAGGSPLDIKIGNMLAAKMGVASGGQAYNAMQNAIDAMVGVGKDSRTYIQNAIVKNMMPQAIAGQMLQSGSPAAVIMMTDAIEKKRVLEAAEASLFMRYVHPLMTFMEGFIYALTPIMAVLIAIGSMGMSLAGKYLLMLLWIQLWMPVMSIVNLYLNMSVKGAMAALQDPIKGNLDPTSIMGQVQMHSTMADWLATAGTLAAATPALALMLVYGSAVTATHLAGRLGGNETVDPSVASPDPMKNRPVLDMASEATHTTLDGVLSSGKGVTQSLQMGNALDQTVQSAHQQASQSQHQLTSMLNNTEASKQGFGNRETTAESLHDTISATGSKTRAFVENSASEASKSFSFQGQQKTDFKAAYGAALEGGLGGKEAARLGVRAALGREASESEVDTAMEQYNSTHSQADSAQEQAGFAQALQQDVSNDKVFSQEKGWDKTKAKSLADAYSKSASDSQTYAEASSLRKSFQASTGGDVRNMLGDKYYSDEQVQNARAMVENGGKTEEERKQRREEIETQTRKNLPLFKGGNRENKAAYSAAMMVAANHLDTGALHSLSEPTLLNTGGDRLDPSDAKRNKDVGTEANAANNKVAQAGSLKAPSSAPSEVKEQVASGQERLAHGKSEVETQAASNMAAVEKQGKANTASQNRHNGVEAAKQMAHNLESKNGAEYLNAIGQGTEKTITDAVSGGTHVIADVAGDLTRSAGAAIGAASATDGDFWKKMSAATSAASDSVEKGSGTLQMAKEAIGSFAAGAGAVSALIDSGSGATMEDLERTFNEASMNYISEHGGEYKPQENSFSEWLNKSGDIVEAYAKEQGLTDSQAALAGASARVGAGITNAAGQNSEMSEAIEGVMKENQALFTDKNTGQVDAESLGVVNEAIIGALQTGGFNDNDIGIKQVKNLDDMLGLGSVEGDNNAPTQQQGSQQQNPVIDNNAPTQQQGSQQQNPVIDNNAPTQQQGSQQQNPVIDNNAPTQQQGSQQQSPVIDNNAPTQQQGSQQQNPVIDNNAPTQQQGSQQQNPVIDNNGSSAQNSGKVKGKRSFIDKK